MPRFIDLSVTIEHGLPSDPPGMIPEIQYLDHAAGAQSMKAFFPGIEEKDLPQGLGWAVERLTISTHAGTHMDAPWHFHPTQDKGKPAMTIDEIPIEWCMGNGVVLDMTDKKHGYRVMPKDLDNALEKINHQLAEGDIVLIKTGADKYFGTSDYLVKGCGMGRDATLHILDQGVRVVGTDAWSWDPPLPIVAKRFSRTKDKSLIWEGHFAGIEKGYLQIEKLTNLDLLPPKGFTFFCFPVKIKRASAGWVRAVAMIKEE